MQLCVVGTPSPYSKGVTDDIKADLLRNQRVLIRMCFKLCPRRCVSAFGGKWFWDCSDPSQVFGALVNYKRKFMTGIISSWENYIKHVVSNYIQFVYIQFVLVILYYFITFFYNLFITKLHIYNLQGSKCLWIHHWVVLQFLHEHFVVGRNTDLSGPDEDNGRVYNFKHDNWSKMIKSVDCSYEDQYKQIYGYQPRLSLVWLGYTRRPVVDDEDDRFESTVPVGDGDACDASDKVGKKSKLKSTGSTT
jgi:hypothetical protein